MERERQRDRLQRCLQAVEEHPELAASHFNLGLAYTTSGRVQLAEEAYLEAVKIDPGMLQAWVNLGGVRLMRWDFDGCLEANQRAAAIDSECVEAHFNMGQAYLYKNEPERLLECNRRVLELDRDHPAAHYFSAVAALALEDLGLTERHLARAMELGHSPPPEFMKAMEKAHVAKAREENVKLIEITGASGPDNPKEE